MNKINWEAIKINDSWFWTVIAGAAIIFSIVLLFRHGKTIIKFFHEMWVELKRCSWPWDPDLKGMRKYKELIDSSVVVIISSVLLAAYIMSMDFILTNIISVLTGTQALN